MDAQSTNLMTEIERQAFGTASFVSQAPSRLFGTTDMNTKRLNKGISEAAKAAGLLRSSLTLQAKSAVSTVNCHESASIPSFGFDRGNDHLEGQPGYPWGWNRSSSIRGVIPRVAGVT